MSAAFQQRVEKIHQSPGYKPRYPLLPTSDLLNAPPLEWLIRGVIPAQGLACIFGQSRSGKSFLALDMCAAVGAGNPWFGYKVKAVPVAYMLLEGEAGFSQRLKAWQLHHGCNAPAGLRFIREPFDLRKSSHVRALAGDLLAGGCEGGLLMIDTLNRASSGANENESADMGLLIDAMKLIQSSMRGCVAMVHHSGKDPSRGLRGHSSLIGALDANIEVVRLDARREWRIDKAKDGGDESVHQFRLEVIEVGTYDDGDPITSCAVEADDLPREFRRVLPPKSGNMRVIWDALGELLRKVGDTRPPDAPDRLPPGRPAVALEGAIEALRDRLACDPKRRTERAQQALTGLQAKGLIVIDRGYVWAT